MGKQQNVKQWSAYKILLGRVCGYIRFKDSYSVESQNLIESQLRDAISKHNDVSQRKCLEDLIAGNFYQRA